MTDKFNKEALTIWLKVKAELKYDWSMTLKDQELVVDAIAARMRLDAGEIQSHVDDVNRLLDQLAQAQAEIERLKVTATQTTMWVDNCRLRDENDALRSQLARARGRS